jgi:hypothetical protein
MEHLGTRDFCSIGAHALLEEHADAEHWRWKPRDDLEDVYLLLTERFSAHNHLNLKRKCQMAKLTDATSEHCMECVREASRENYLQEVRRRPSLLQEQLFETEQEAKEMDRVSNGKEDFRRCSDAVSIRDEIANFMVARSARFVNTPLFGMA